MNLKRVLALACAAQLLAGTALAGTATPGTAALPDKNAIGWAQLPLGYQPPADSDEAGLWMTSAQAEEQLRGSPFLVKDPALNTYVRNIVCKLAGPYCELLRIYILDVPYFNASMAPNGVMIVWTGLLLRAQNEAQLSFVLGHEITHFLLRHSTEQYRRLRDTYGAMAVISLITAGAGIGLAGLLINAGISGTFLSFSRDEEREADAHGFDLAIEAGYDPAQARSLWQEEYDEEKANPHPDSPGMFGAMHPESSERLQTMSERAAKVEDTRKDWQIDAAEYRAAIAPFRAKWLDENLALGNYDQSLELARELLKGEPDSGELQYFLAEVYRRRNKDGDAANAIAAYRAAIADGGAPNDVYRGLGLSLMKSKDQAGARTAFQDYLAAAPKADDRAMVEYYLSRL